MFAVDIVTRLCRSSDQKCSRRRMRLFCLHMARKRRGDSGRSESNSTFSRNPRRVGTLAQGMDVGLSRLAADPSKLRPRSSIRFCPDLTGKA